MLDFDNFLFGAKSIFSGINPYGNIDFFAPAWTTFFIIPFALIPRALSEILWQLFSILSAIALSIIAAPKRRLFALFVIFSPAMLLLLTLGQLSAFVALACTNLLLEARNKRRFWFILLWFFLSSLKPHLAAFPILIALITLIRKKDYWKIICIAIFVILLALILEIVVPHCNIDWLIAMFSGNYKKEEQSLLYVTLSSGLSFPFWISAYKGVIWMFVPVLGLYVYYYWKELLTPRVIGLTLSIPFLVLPYYKLYDFVLLIYPVGILLDSIIDNISRKSIDGSSKKVSKRGVFATAPGGLPH